MYHPRDLPDEMLLRPSKLKWMGVLAVGVILGLGGVLMLVEEGGVMPWFCIIFFGLVAATAFVQLLGGSYLRLDADGFEQSMIGRKMNCRWDEVSSFGVWSMSGNKFVTFNRAGDSGKVMTAVNTSIAGASSQLGDTFGMKAEAAATHQRHVRQTA